MARGADGGLSGAYYLAIEAPVIQSAERFNLGRY
jgi:hypothetical protein